MLQAKLADYGGAPFCFQTTNKDILFHISTADIQSSTHIKTRKLLHTCINVVDSIRLSHVLTHLIQLPWLFKVANRYKVENTLIADAGRTSSAVK